MRSLPILALSLAASTAPSCSGRDLDFGPPTTVITIRPPPGGIIDSAGGLGQPIKVALAGDIIVFSTAAQVMTIPVTGGTPRLQSSVGAPVTALATDTRFAFWVDQSGVIYALDLATNSISVLTMGRGQASGIAIDETNVYWTANRALYALPRIAWTLAGAGAFLPVELASGFTAVGRVATAAGSVVFVASDDESPNGKLVRLPTSGDLPNTVARGAFPVWSVATDGSSAFWTAFGVEQFKSAPEGGVYRADLTGGVITRLSPLVGYPGQIVMVGEHLYFHDTALRRVSTSGAPDTWMPIPSVYCYAVNERSLVWVTSDAGGWALMVRTVPATMPP